MSFPFDSDEARFLNLDIFETVYHVALDASAALARDYGPYPAWYDSAARGGELYINMWPIAPSEDEELAGLRTRIARDGLRNTTLTCQPLCVYFPGLFGESSGAQPHAR